MHSRKILVILGVILVGVLIYWFFGRNDTHIKNFPAKKSGPVVLFGDSLAEGVGSTQKGDMASLLTVALNEPVLNYGMAGDTTALGLSRLDQVLTSNPRLVIVLLGGNDFLQKIDRATTARNLESIITQLQDQGAIVLLLGVRSGIVGGGADKLYEDLAERTGSAYEEDVLKGVFGNPSLMSDAIHPNDAGYAKIVDRLLPLVKKLLQKGE